MNPAEWLSAVVQDPALKTTDRAVAAALWSFMDRDGVCWPGHKKLGPRAGLSKRDYLRAALDRLETAGWLRITVQPSGRYSTNVYEAVDKSSCAPRKGSRGVTRLADFRPPAKGVTHVTREGGHELSQRELRDGGSAEPVDDGVHPIVSSLADSKRIPS